MKIRHILCLPTSEETPPIRRGANPTSTQTMVRRVPGKLLPSRLVSLMQRDPGCGQQPSHSARRLWGQSTGCSSPPCKALPVLSGFASRHAGTTRSSQGHCCSGASPATGKGPPGPPSCSKGHAEPRLAGLAPRCQLPLCPLVNVSLFRARQMVHLVLAACSFINHTAHSQPSSSLGAT